MSDANIDAPSIRRAKRLAVQHNRVFFVVTSRRIEQEIEMLPADYFRPRYGTHILYATWPRGYFERNKRKRRARDARYYGELPY